MTLRNTAIIIATIFIAGCGQADDPWANGQSGKGDGFWDWLTGRQPSALEASPQLQNVREAHVFTRNEDALSAKLRVIDAAQSGETLDLVYYIFADDESSAFLASRLIAAARRGVKVRVLLDYFTNWSRWYYYSLIWYKATNENTSGGSLDFAFYNRPTVGIAEDALFMVTPCTIPGELITSSRCTEDRKAHMSSPESQKKAVMFLTGLYGKSSTAMEAALADVMGQFEAAQQSGSEEDVDKSAMMKGLKLIFDAEIKGEIGAKLALFFFASQLKPLTDAADSINMFGLKKNDKDWEHLTDYIHQKLTLRTGAHESEVVLGGRNVENSYHLSELPRSEYEYFVNWDLDVPRKAWDTKYSFMDVDFYAKFSGTSIRERFERIWNFRQMVAGQFELSGPDPRLEVDGKQVLTPYGPDYLDLAVQRFLQYYSFTDDIFVEPKIAGPAYTRGATQLPVLGHVDASAYYYVENIPNEQGERMFATNGEWDNEVEAGKRIHALWLEQLEQVCSGSTRKEVIFHNAYLLLPTRIQRALLKYVTDPKSCPGVSKFTIITNSRESTDLNVVNIFNESYIKPLLDRAPAGRLEYYEYTTDQVTGPAGINPVKRSLHAKVMIFGDNIFIGSANADGRSMFMDANNGVFMTNAFGLIEKYKAWLSSQIIGVLAVADRHSIATTQHDALLADNLTFFKSHIIDRWFSKQAPEQQLKMQTSVQQTCEQLYDVSSIVMPTSTSKKSSIRAGGENITKNNEEIMVMTDRQVKLL